MAGLGPRSKALLSGREVVLADQYFAKLRDELESGGLEATAWDEDWARSVLDRLPDQAWSTPLYRLWWSIGEKDGASPPGFRPGLVGGTKAPRRRLSLMQADGLAACAWSPAAEPDPAAGSPLAMIATRNGHLQVEPLESFWAGGEPPSWAHDWGEDEIGPWVTFRIEKDAGAFVEQKMRWIRPGRFKMGSPETEAERFDDEGPQHEVTISRGFWLFDTACTQDPVSYTHLTLPTIYSV